MTTCGGCLRRSSKVILAIVVPKSALCWNAMQTNSLIPEGTYGVVQRDVFHSSLDEVAEQIRRLGYAVIDSGYTEAELHALSEAFDMARAAYVQRWGEARLKSLGELHTLRALLTHGGPLFLKLATHRVLLELLGRLIEGKFALSQQNGVINPAGESYNQGAWHRDLPTSTSCRARLWPSTRCSAWTISRQTMGRRLSFLGRTVLMRFRQRLICGGMPCKWRQRPASSS